MGNGMRPGKMPAALAEGFAHYDNWLVAAAFAFYLRAFRDRPGLARACKWAFQAGGAAIVVWACVSSATMIYSSGDAHGVRQVLVLLFAYGAGSLLSFNKVLYVMDFLTLYMAGIAVSGSQATVLTVTLAEVLSTAIPLPVIAAVWVILRLGLGSLAVFYKKAVRINLANESGGRLG